MKIIYPEKPIKREGFIGGGMSQRKYFPVYHFSIKNGYKEKSIEFGKGYLQALNDVKRLNPEPVKEV